MHLLVSHAAALAPDMLAAVDTSSLPHAQALLDSLAAGPRDEGDESSLSPPHERALAGLWHWPVVDGLLPFAAHAALADGLDPARQTALGWGLLSPTYWHLGTERVALADPVDLQLDEAASRQLFGAVAGLFDSDGWQLQWGAATRWYALHASLAQLPTAALDRVVGRPVDLWLGEQAAARPLRRLQAEAQMLLHTHPVNDARQSAGLAPVNSVWLSGTGSTRKAAPTVDLTVDHSLRRSALAADPARWAAAWLALDAGPMRTLLEHAQRGGEARLTLCGERHAQTWATPVRSRLMRWFGARTSVQACLHAL